MIRNKPLNPSWITTLALILSLALIGGCTSTSSKQLERLSKILRVYNNAFESKSENGGSMYVQNDYRMDYLMKYGDIQSRVSFLDVQTLNHAYFNDGKPVTINVNDPESEFNEAVITLRYRLTISPSNRVKTFIHEQRWKYEKTTWRLEPNLEPFLK